MAAGEQMNNPFEWGDEVRILDPAVVAEQGYGVASVCGFRVVDHESTAREFGVSLGACLVLIELPSGESLELPAGKLELIPDQLA
jgi:hypothetical protein